MKIVCKFVCLHFVIFYMLNYLCYCVLVSSSSKVGSRIRSFLLRFYLIYIVDIRKQRARVGWIRRHYANAVHCFDVNIDRYIFRLQTISFTNFGDQAYSRHNINIQPWTCYLLYIIYFISVSLMDLKRHQFYLKNYSLSYH